jgi:3-deoxy-D-arabino-heptulosonate 7-phosphate (DAHP) synthase
MGKGKKADPAKIAAKKAKAAAKQEKSAIKANKKDIKTLGTNEEDIETILAEYQEKEKTRTTVTITPCSQPSPRSNFSLTALSNNEFLLFG